MWLHDLLEWLRDTPLAMEVQQSSWVFATLESLHVVAVMLVFGSIAMVDLRLLGATGRDRPVTHTATDALPWTWAGFAVAILTGVLLFTAQPTKYAENREFLVKMLLLLLAGVNMLVFHFLTWRGVARWDDGPPTPLAAKLAGALSLLFWVGAVAAGRLVGWTLI